MKNKKEIKEIIIGLLITSFVIVLGIILAQGIIRASEKQYFYGLDDMNGHSNNCYESKKGGLYCEIPIKVKWYYEEQKHENN